MKRRLLLSALTFAAVLSSAEAFALPSTQDVAAAVKAGNYPQAETLIKEVIAARPQSAKAHYEYAEILAYEARFGDAVVEARKAREIDPKIAFTDPQKFHQFEQELQREQAAPAQVAPTQQVAPARVIQQPVPYTPPASSGIPGWVWFGGIALLLFFVFRAVSRRAMGMGQPGANGGGFVNQGGGYGMQPGYGQPGYGQPGYGQAPGGGLLRTGLAAAGGVAAGMLVEKMLDERHDEYRDDRSGLMGGGAGAFDNDSSRAATELENRPFDQGNGNDWGGDGGGGGGSDFTPSGDDGGW